MGAKKFKRTELELPEPSFGSELTSLVVELEHLRRLQLKGTTHGALFFELKKIFHYLESHGSARIEGNNTTIAEYIETKLENRPYVNEQIEEIRNIEEAMVWIDENYANFNINRRFVSEIHKMVVKNLTPPPKGEGDRSPGSYREHQVQIQGSSHVPPEPVLISEYMQELFDFINGDAPSQFDLIKVAIAHHRFMWIHPFSNGNGRTGRLLTYGMLVKMGFKVNVGQILNPTAVFCIDRSRYHERLAKADTGSDNDIEEWCLYVLEGMRNEILKIERLTDHDYVYNSLLLPALRYSFKKQYINDEERSILKLAAKKQVIQNSDVQKILKDQHTVTISRKIKGLRERNMLIQEKSNSHKYHLSFINNFLIRGMIFALEKEGYIPVPN